jgi:hypothetical protein
MRIEAAQGGDFHHARLLGHLGRAKITSTGRFVFFEPLGWTPLNRRAFFEKFPNNWAIFVRMEPIRGEAGKVVTRSAWRHL